MIFKYQFTTDEDQVMLDMLQYFDDIGLPSHIDQKSIRESLRQVFQQWRFKLMTKKILDQNKLYKLPEFNNMVMTGKEIEDLIESAYNELMLSKRRIKK